MSLITLESCEKGLLLVPDTTCGYHNPHMAVSLAAVEAYLKAVPQLEGHIKAKGMEAGGCWNAMCCQAGVQLSKSGLQVGGVHCLLLMQPLQHSQHRLWHSAK